MSVRSEFRIRALTVGSAFAILGFAAACSAPDATPQPVVQQSVRQNIAVVAPVLENTPTLVAADLVSQAEAAQQVYINIYQRVNPSVVNIELATDSTQQIDASGSGFVIDNDGHILTNNHVIDKEKDITVTFSDGYTATATVVGVDDYSDLAVIKVDVPKSHLLPVTFGTSAGLQVGQRVVAIGNPFGLLSSMTTGIVSATGRTLNSSHVQYRNPSIIQIDAQINPGNSGGPLLDIDGKVIGVNTAISSDTGFFQGVGFAVPIDTVKRVIPQLIKSGKAEYSWLGIKSIGGRNGLSVAALADRLKLSVTSGVLVTDVTADSPAAQAGLRGGLRSETVRGVQVPVGGDIIVAINGQPLRDLDGLLAYLVDNTAPGDTVTLTVVRDNSTFEAKVTLQARPPDAATAN